MSEIEGRIRAALKTAMKEGDKLALGTLRLMNAAIKDRAIALRGQDGDGRVDDAEVIAILGRMVRQRRESARAYEEGGRLELAAEEEAEIEVIERFLPRKLSEAETAAAVDAAVAETEAASIRDMGRVMGVLKARHAGRMDFSAVGPMVKARLAT